MSEQYLQQGQQWLETLLKQAGFPARVSTEQPDGTTFSWQSLSGYWLTIAEADLSPEQVQHLLAEQGVVLDALQYLINATLNLGQSREAQEMYIIELAGYRAKRYAHLCELAEQAAAQVRETGQEYEMPSLSAADRRLIHTVLQETNDLETFSRGQEPDRRLVVRPQALESAQ